jgi:hypothetical protein
LDGGDTTAQEEVMEGGVPKMSTDWKRVTNERMDMGALGSESFQVVKRTKRAAARAEPVKRHDTR